VSNQCDGCIRGIPVVNGMHKDEQMFGMMCTKGRYNETSTDKEIISKLKMKINQLEQKLESHNGRVTGAKR